MKYGGISFDTTSCSCTYPQWDEKKMTMMQKYNRVMQEADAAVADAAVADADVAG